MRAPLGVIVACVLLTLARAGAQPLPDPLPPDPKGTSTTTKIPVVMPSATEVLQAENVASSATGAGVSVEGPVDPETYVCGPGDVFEINFWGPQNFRLRIAADLEGRAFITKVGFVGVYGKTLAVVRREVTKKVRENYPGLRFELTLVSPRSFLVHVANNVKHPGTYVASPLERVSSIIGKAGGATGSRRQIRISRNGKEIIADLVLYDLTGDTRHNPYVLDGDVIQVPFPELKVGVSGAVRRQGTFDLVGSKDLAELLQLAGGLTSGVARSLPIRILRRDTQDRATYVEVPFKENGSVPNVALQDLDQVEFRDAEELQRTVLLIGAVVGADKMDQATTSRRLNFVEGDTVFTIIQRAGGASPSGDLQRSYISRPRAGAQPELIPLDLERLLVRRDLGADKPVVMNDTIVVPPLQYAILVEGAVNRAGMYPFNPQFGVPEYIAHAGGRTRTARDMDEVKLIDWSGKTHNYKDGIRLKPGDSILVPERNFTRAEIAQLVLAAAGLLVSGVAVGIAATR